MYYTSRQLFAIVILGAALLAFCAFRYYLANTTKLAQSLSPDVWLEIKGDVVRPGIYRLPSKEANLGNLIQKAGGLSDGIKNVDPGLMGKKVAYGDSWLVSIMVGGKICAKRKRIPGFRALALGLKMPINSATKDDLLALPLMNKKIASKIIMYRKLNGPFTSLVQLKNVPGVTERRMNRWEPYISFEVDKSEKMAVIRGKSADKDRRKRAITSR